MSRIIVDGITVDVTLKRIKHVHLSVQPPAGRVRISAPLRTDLQMLRAFVAAKLDWIKKQQERLKNQANEAQRELVDGETHPAWGESYLLRVVEGQKRAGVELKDGQMILRVSPAADRQMRQGVMDAWYRDQIRQAAPALIAKWEVQMGVKVDRLYVRRMKTRWGSCNPRKRSIRLNSELAKKALEYLEYVVVHELAHLIEPSHSRRFVEIMDRYLPEWRVLKRGLNHSPDGIAARGH